jgi:hypothetical protein
VRLLHATCVTKTELVHNVNRSHKDIQQRE